MNDLLKEKLNDLGISAADNIDKICSLAQDQLPSLMQEIIHWGIVKHSGYCCIGLFFILLFFFVKKQIDKLNISTSDKAGFTILIFGISSFISIPIISINLYWVGMAYFAPRLYLLEVFSELIGK